MKRLLRLLRRWVHDRRRFRFYAYESDPMDVPPDARISVHGSWASIPPAFRKVAMPAPGMSAMFWRMRRGGAKLLCLSEDGRKLAAYGWIQEGRIFRRKFGSLVQGGTMLGPYWTSPEARGRGLYGRLLAHSLSLCAKNKPILIYAAPENTASRRGIEKAGFRSLGEWERKICLGVVVQFRQVVP